MFFLFYFVWLAATDFFWNYLTLSENGTVKY